MVRQTARMLLRPPGPNDAEAIFRRYASCPQVTRYLGWPTHQTLADTRAFISLSEHAWRTHGRGPYLAIARQTGQLVGSTGLDVETPKRAATGYVLARDAWGQGLATELLGEMIADAREFGIVRLHALVHPQHTASTRVLDKQGFACEGRLRRYQVLPNLDSSQPADVLCYARVLS